MDYTITIDDKYVKYVDDYIKSQNYASIEKYIEDNLNCIAEKEINRLYEQSKQGEVITIADKITEIEKKDV